MSQQNPLNNNTVYDKTTHKYCKKCDTIKMLSDFPLNRGKPYYCCGKCNSKRTNENRKKRLTGEKTDKDIVSNNIDYDKTTHKYCKKCDRVKILSDFSLTRGKPNYCCKECRNKGSNENMVFLY